jgi:hypothetical protein
MAISVSNVVNNTAGGNQTITLVNGNYYIVMTDGGAPTTNAGITLSLLYNNTSTGVLRVYGGYATSSVSCTFTYGSYMAIDMVSGMASTSCIVQSVGDTSGNGTGTFTITLGTFTSTNNGTYMCGSSNAYGAFNVKSGYTQLASNTGNPYQKISEYLTTNDTAPSLQWTSSQGNQQPLWACEIAVAAVASTNNVCIINCGI